MKRSILTFFIAGVLMTPAHSQDFRPLVDALYGQMTAAYMCRDALGGLGQYQAARSIAMSTATRLMGANDGPLAIDAFEKKLTTDPRSATPAGDTKTCNEIVNNGLQKIQMEQAKLGLL